MELAANQHLAQNRNSPVIEREEERRMLPCRFFSNGFCHKGNRCRFYHPSPQNMANAIRSPPLPVGFGGPGHRASVSPVRQPRGSHGMNRTQSQGRMTYYEQAPFNNGNAQFGVPNMTSTPQPNANHRRPRTCDISGFGYPSNNLNGLQTYDYDAGDESAMMHQQLLESSSQTTLFTHIDWNDFLAPGKLPPPVTNVPEQEFVERHSPSIFRKALQLLQSQSPNSSGDQLVDGADTSGDERPQASLSNEDMPPEGSMVRRRSGGQENEEPEIEARKLSAKEELQMKVKKIAMELADEPDPETSVRSRDSFFRDYENINELLPIEMLETIPRKKLELEEAANSSSRSNSSEDGSRMSDSSRNDDVVKAINEIAMFFPDRMSLNGEPGGSDV